MKHTSRTEADRINRTERIEKDENRDPISGAPGAHPVGTGVGAASVGTAGAAIGSLAGPIGAAVGMVAGAVAGGYAGKGVAEIFDPTVEAAYWQDEYRNRPYTEENLSYDNYQDAYRIGYEGYAKYPDRSFDEVELELKREFEKSPAAADMSWEKAKHPARDAWDRVENATPHDLNDARR